jgi:Zn-dependent protease with chaperone function
MSALPFLLHGATLACSWFLLCNVAMTATVTIVSALLARRDRPVSAGLWLALRLAPAVLSLAFVAALFLPSYLRYEPREDVEGFDVTLTALAVLALSVAGIAAARGVTAWRGAARRIASWMRTATPLSLPGAAMPAFAIDSDTPVMALVGVWRPRLLVTRPILDHLTAEELRACVAHEAGHWRALDNLKRLAMRTAPDLLSMTPAAPAIERRWAAASEHAADRRAGVSGDARCALASALVKVARLMPAPVSIAEPISALVDGGDITARVTRLLDEPAPPPRPAATLWLACAAAATAFAIGYAPLLRLVHGVTEVLVNRLP